MNIKDYSETPLIKAIHVGPSGDGKSVAAASYPGVFHEIDIDDRFDGIASVSWLPHQEIDYERFEVRAGFENIEAHITKLEGFHRSGNFPFKTIELASATTLAKALIYTSHRLQSGRKVGNITLSGPNDFYFEVSGVTQTIDALRALPCNLIICGHIIEKWGKPKGALNPYVPNEIIGERLSLRDQLAATVLAIFSNVFQFSRQIHVENQKKTLKYFVEYANADLAKNAFGIPPGFYDITKKPFYAFTQELIKKVRSGEDVTQKIVNPGGLDGLKL